MDFITNDLLNIILIILFLFFSTASLFAHIFNLPGNIFILIEALLLGWYGQFQFITSKILIILIVLVIIGELLEFLVGIIGAKKYKTSNRAIVVSIVFGIVCGIIFAPVFLGFGALLGAFFGAYIGALIVELLSNKNINESMKSAWGVFLGKIGGTFSKIIVGIIMIIITMKAVLFSI